VQYSFIVSLRKISSKIVDRGGLRTFICNMKDEQLDYSVEERSAYRLVSLKGKLVLYNVDQVRTDFFRLIDEDQKDLVLNMQELEFVDSSGVGLLIQMHRRMEAGKRKVRLANVSELLFKVLKVAGLDKIFDISRGPVA
jgi:anti-anti-sigma factor